MVVALPLAAGQPLPSAVPSLPRAGVTVSRCYQLAFPWQSVSADKCTAGDMSSTTAIWLNPWSGVITRSNSALDRQNIRIFIEHSNQQHLFNSPCKSSS